MSAYAVVSIAEVPDPLPDRLTVLDVREDGEWDAGHVEGAVHIPLRELPVRLGEVPAGALLVVCRVGARSERAADWLSRQDRDVTNLAGGLQDWEAAGRPLVDGRGAAGRVG